MDDAPEFAAALGRLIAHWGFLEGELSELLGILLRLDQARASMVFNTFPALGQKIGLIERLLYSFTQENEARNVALNFCKRAKALADDRNKYIHATWGGGDGEFCIFSKGLPSSTKKRLSIVPGVKVQDIQNDVDKVAVLSQEILDFRVSQALRLVILQSPLA